jgi:uncharacterized protein (TIGR02680 family)
MTVTELPIHAASVAAPDRPDRWLPTRAGILNVWRYHDETFEFHDGRLLLRGPNGSGKSKALELLLPFLFDASLRANRLSTFGTGERTMHWNLMGEGAGGTTRVGYVWLEFGRAGDQWFSCGARLQASTHTTAVHVDYFTTGLRIGRADGLMLVNDARQPLTRAVLEAALGDQGALHDNAADYRAAVRAALFPGMSEQRYDALITALLQLRTPKLSQRLDPALLSTLLSRALPPLGRQEIVDLAEGFERLDAQRQRLADLEGEVTAAQTLARRQRSYARRVLRATAAALISKTTDLDNVTRAARQSTEEHARAAERKAQEEARSELLEGRVREAEARIDGITQSEAYRQGRDLDDLRQQSRRATLQADKVRAEAGSLRATADEDEQHRQAAGQARSQRADARDAAAADARAAAAHAGLAGTYEELDQTLRARADDARKLLRAVVSSRLEQLDTVSRALGAHERAVTRRQEAEDELGAARAGYADARARWDEAGEQRATALAELARRLAEWAAGCRELAFTDPGVLGDLAESEAAVLAAVEAAAATVLHEVTRAETVAGASLGTARGERAELIAEIDRVAAERDVPPTAPHTRTADRGALRGAALWRLVDFAPGVPTAGHPLIEAALESAGLLDAWISADGRIAGHDVLADPTALPAVAGRSLADVLVPEQDGAVGAEVIRRLLGAIAFGDRLPAGPPAAVGADGTWRLGSLTGSWHKAHADYIGAAARERARQRRLAELRAGLADCDARIARLTTELAALAARRAALDTERAARPRHDELHAATEKMTRAEADLDAADGIVRRRMDTLSERERAAVQALHTLMSVAATAKAPTDRPALAALVAATRTFGEQADNWLAAHGQLVTADQALQSAAIQADRSGAAARGRETEAAEAETERDRLDTVLVTVEKTIGADYKATLLELKQTRELRSDHAGQLTTARDEINGLAQQLGKLEERRSTDATARDAATEARDAAARRFRGLASGVLGVDGAGDDPAQFRTALTGSDGVTAALRSAQQVAAAWTAVPYEPRHISDALNRLAETVHECRTALSTRADLDMAADEDVQVFTAVVDGVRVGAARLHEILTEEMARSRAEITDRERELFDQTLTGDTRRHLADRIRQANELVDGMNARLERVRTASKVAVRLVWQVAEGLPEGTRAARDLLLRDPARLTEADRESLHQFFRQRIEQAKASGTAASWEEQLAEVLDYTSWHRFVVKLDRDNGAGWQQLTKKLHGALSGGEKAIALHLPLFAAVAAHYQAVPESPRVILLDEVFVGVDSANRGQIFALLSALDLDLLLTSDHEWCTYAELDGISVHQLITGDGDDAVTTARFTWNGHELTPAEP